MDKLADLQQQAIHKMEQEIETNQQKTNKKIAITNSKNPKDLASEL